MDRAGVVSVLRKAEQAAELPRLGGMARAEGVVIASERFWAFARRDGSVSEGVMPAPPSAVRLVSLALTMELWQLVQASRYPVARAFLLPGLALQRLTTREPSDEETRIALTAVASVLQRELSP